MRSDSTSGPAPTALVFWIIWASLFSGMFVILHFVGGGWPSGASGDPYLTHLFFWLPVGAVFASQIVRWLVLPRLQRPEAMLAPAVVGMSLAEGAMMLAIFLLPKEMVEGRQIVIILSFLGVLTFAPIYLRPKDAGSKGHTDGGNYLK